MISIVFFGTPSIGLKSLEHFCLSDKFEVLAVVTQPDRPSGRGQKLMPSPIKEYALERGIKVFQPKSIRKEPEIIEELKRLKPDFFVTFAFGQILSQEVLDIPKYETINLHASLLPKYRGANPIQRAIINGDKETGICTMITELGLDCGDVCLKCPIEIPENMNCSELFEICASISPELLDKTLTGIKNGMLKPLPQCEDGVCYADKLKKEECRIDWNKSAREIHNLARGIYPSAFFEYRGKVIKVLQSEIIENGEEDKIIGSTSQAGFTGVEFSSDEIRYVKVTKFGIDVITGSGILRLIKIKPESKGEMFACDWANGALRV